MQSTSAGTQRQPSGTRRPRPGPLARLDRIPVWPYERKLLWVVGAGYFFAFFDIVTISFAAPVIATQFHVSKSTVTLSVTSSLIGYIIGALANSTIADKWGRKLSLTVSVAVFSVGTILAATSTNITELIIFRFIAGLGIGAEIAAVTTYIGELSPARLRGRYTSWATTAAYAGFAVVPFVARALVPTFASGWRILFLIGALGGLTILFMRRNLPPSFGYRTSLQDIRPSAVDMAFGLAGRRFLGCRPHAGLCYELLGPGSRQSRLTERYAHAMQIYPCAPIRRNGRRRQRPVSIAGRTVH